MHTQLTPEHVRYIKCGSEAAFWPQARAQGWIPVGFVEVPFEVSRTGTPADVKELLVAMGKAAQVASRDATELMEFCHLPAGTLFVTFADRHLWWAEAAEEVIELDPDQYGGVSRARRTKAGWSNIDMNGSPLSMERLPTRITKTAGYRKTICAFKDDERDLLLRRINATPDVEMGRFADGHDKLRTDLATILRRLNWLDVEQLADLIFARNGWRRMTPLGAQEMDIDLIAEEPVFGTRAWVQVKARSNTKTVMDYLGRFEADGSCERFVFVCTDLTGRADAIDLPEGAELWSGTVLASKVMDAGLTDWVFDRI